MCADTILATKSRKWWNANMYHRPLSCFTLKCDMMALWIGSTHCLFSC